MTSEVGHEAAPPGSQQQAFEAGVLPAIHQSAALLARDQGAFTRQLHYDVTSLIPESAVPPAFDMRGFCDRMAQALLWVALADQPLHVVVDSLRQLGAQNWYEGFPDAQYASVAHALIQTVHYLNANIWSTATGSSWISFFMWVQPHLLAGAATPPPARPQHGKRPPARPSLSAPPPSRRPPASPPFPEATPRSSTTSTSSG